MKPNIRTTGWIARLILLNIFLFGVFVESYIWGGESERWHGLELPFFTFFIAGVFVFFFVMIWLTIGNVLYHSLGRKRELLARVVWLSDLPFIVVIISLWLGALTSWTDWSADIQSLVIICTIFVGLYPLFMILAHTHAEMARALEK